MSANASRLLRSRIPLLWIPFFVPLALVGLAWLLSYSVDMAYLYDAERSERWMLYRGSVYRWDGFRESPLPTGRFDFDVECDGSPGGPENRVFYLWCPAMLALVMASIPVGRAILVVRQRRHRILDGRCGGCGYNLTGNVSGVCPECGRKIPAEQRPTADE